MEENIPQAKKNWALIAGLAIPFILIAVLFLSVYVPKLLNKPRHNFLFTFADSDYRHLRPVTGTEMLPYQETIYEVREGKLTASARTFYYYPGDKPVANGRLYFYDVRQNKSREIDYQETVNYKLDASRVAPDGFEISFGGRGGGFFPFFYEGGGYDYNVQYLKKGFASQKLNLPSQPNNYYYGNNNFQFLGWVAE